MNPSKVMIDGNDAAAHVAYRLSEVIAIYPITPSSGMGELSDEWAAKGQPNLWGHVPDVIELQSEGGASGAVHGAVTTGALSTTFTASQGLLLMIPNMFKIAGELTPVVFHVSARSVATHALSIFGDHSDVMAARMTGFAFLAAGSVQEVMDMAVVAHAATLSSRIPFVHFFDGFRTSHELSKIDPISDDQIRSMISDEHIIEHRARSLSPDHPTIKGTAQNPDVFFQARETVNPFYDATPGKVIEAMDKLHEATGRRYNLFDYVGAPDAERVIIMMGSGAEAAHEAVDALTAKGEKVGLLKVRLYRPFSISHFVKALPASVKTLSVLDRTKEPGAVGEPLYQDVITALTETMNDGTAPFDTMPKVVGGRYGLSSKEFTPAMVKAVFDSTKTDKPKNHFTIGIKDDVTHTSLEWDASFSTEPEGDFRGLFYGLGSDGTVSANKNSIKIIGGETDNYAQGYFVYDSKKAGAVTVSHLRFGPEPIRSTYLVSTANFIACHNWSFLEQIDVLEFAAKGATFLINSPYGKEKVWGRLSKDVRETIIEKEIKVYVIDAATVAHKAGMGGRTNTIMQTAFFAISNILPREEAIDRIKTAIKKTYGGRGEEVVKMNYAAVDMSIENLHQLDVPSEVGDAHDRPPIVADNAPDFVKNVTAPMLFGKGESLPVSAMPIDGTFPMKTTQWEKRNIALEIPVWEVEACIQCAKCVIACPHAAIRQKVAEPSMLKDAPETLKSADFRGKEFKGLSYLLQVAPEDCTGCGVCVDVCPAKSKVDPEKRALDMAPQMPLREAEAANWDFFINKVPNPDRRTLKVNSVKGSQFLEPLFEFSGACAGCGETPYVKLASQLFGDRMIVANATGCSSIYGGNLPTTPWADNEEGRGTAWSNSLFEDNAEFGLGFRLTFDRFNQQAKNYLNTLEGDIGKDLVEKLMSAEQKNEADIYAYRELVEELKTKLEGIDSGEARQLHSLADYLSKKSVWIMGGDGWAYDIGYGGLDHVLASGRNVNILVMDTEVYSNTGGQASKATPIGAVAKFAADGKSIGKKDLALLAMSYGDVYVARVSMGANDTHTVRAFMEAEAFDGPSIIIAYSQCIAHGIDMAKGMQQAKAAVDTGHWPLFRYNPEGESTKRMKLDSKPPKMAFADYAYNENRYRMLKKADPERAAMLMDKAQDYVNTRWKVYADLVGIDFTDISVQAE